MDFVVSYVLPLYVTHPSPTTEPSLVVVHNNRDQNFGINDLAAIQDVRNEFNLQDIADDPAVDRGKPVSEHEGASSPNCANPRRRSRRAREVG